MRRPVDRNGVLVGVGSRVRVVQLLGAWQHSLPEDEKANVQSMVGELFEVEQVDEYGQPWVRKSWPNEEEGTCLSHSIALEPAEFECVDNPAS